MKQKRRLVHLRIAMFNTCSAHLILAFDMFGKSYDQKYNSKGGKTQSVCRRSFGLFGLQFLDLWLLILFFDVKIYKKFVKNHKKSEISPCRIPHPGKDTPLAGGCLQNASSLAHFWGIVFHIEDSWYLCQGPRWHQQSVCLVSETDQSSATFWTFCSLTSTSFPWLVSPLQRSCFPVFSWCLLKALSCSGGW